MSPDTAQNITVALTLLIRHNFLAILYSAGIILSTIFALWQPKRFLVLFMIGFSMLLLGFEYQKHIKDALYEQTRSSLITERESARIEKLISVAILRIAPLMLQAGGVFSLTTGLALVIFDRTKKSEYNTVQIEEKKRKK